MTGVENNVVFWESYTDTQRLQSVNDIGAAKIRDAIAYWIAQIVGRLVFILFYYRLGGGGVGLGMDKRISVYRYTNTMQHTDLDIWQASIYCPFKFCCRQHMRYHVDIVLWVSKKKMITRQWTLMISCWVVLFFLLPYRVGYSNGILQIDGGSSSANGAKTSSGSSQILRVSPQTLVYLELSPDFCRANITAGMFRSQFNSNAIPAVRSHL